MQLPMNSALEIEFPRILIEIRRRKNSKNKSMYSDYIEILKSKKD